MDAVEKIGVPECRIPLAQAVIYVATAPKSNSSVTAINEAMSEINTRGGGFSVPEHLKDTHYKDASSYGFGKGYKYPHDYPSHYVKQSYLPEQLTGKRYYYPSEEGYELAIKKRIDKLKIL